MKHYWKNGDYQRSETFQLGALLAAVGGFLDAYTFLLHGEVFSNAQTGNIALLGIRLAQGAGIKSFVYLIPIFAFTLGIILTECVKIRYQKNSAAFFHWRQLVVLLEMAVLGGIALIPSGYWNTAVNVLISFVCALQVATFRKIRGNSYATTMCTGNLRSASELFCRALECHDERLGQKSLQYFGVIASFVLGAALGTLLSDRFSSASVLFCHLLLGIVILMMHHSGVDSSASDT